ncbi:DUF4184 family protein [Sporomusa malonica]|uniref:Zinc dependent phospholipase C n=1 Tax=Sporomusa malonica TaxID=112901 RepID=A0A1W2EXA6_9FIRM|nr:DUF4184 family protein [Sporomusa malonica]SMD14349.1 Zinc dependent phospholipase C [Sporomusa malonica]
MHTLHHGFWIYFFTRNHPNVWQFVFGAMLPDYIYVALLGVLLIKGYVTWPELGSLSPGVLMGLVAIFPWVVKIDLIGHSVPIWFSALLISFFPAFRKVQAFIIGWGTHLLIDAFTHGAYSNFFLYPLASYTVESPVSYWEHNHWFREYRLINAGLMSAAAIYMMYEWWKKRKQIKK